MKETTKDEIRQNVQKTYGAIAENESSCCAPSCCAPTQTPDAQDISVGLGYSKEEVEAVPDGANLGLGCGNPQALASLQAGETVLDLGSGAGFDCFLAAKAVGKEGKVIGVDMTAQMLSKARENAKKSGYENVEFRLGEIENLPVADNIVDILMSNCVINLSPDKQKVYSEAYRVLKPGGRLAISDVVAIKNFPEAIKNDIEQISGCVTGAAHVDDLNAMLEQIGYKKIRVELKEESKNFIKNWAPGSNLEQYVRSATIEAIKP